MRVLVRALVLWLTERPFVRRLVQGSGPGRRFAGRFVAGDSLQDGLRAARDLAGLGIAAMLDHLGENVESAEQAAAAADAYILALKQSRELPDLDETELDQPVPHPHPFAKTKLLALLWCAHHEMLHAGQIGLLRRHLGYPPMW